MKDTTKLNIFCDGGARGNPGPAASAFVVQDSQNNILHQGGAFLGSTTNNQAEYQAVINSINWLKSRREESNNDTQITYHLDSQLVVNQIKGLFKVKEPGLQVKCLEVKKLTQELESSSHYKIVSFNYIPRAQNFRADALVNKTLDNQHES